MSLNNVAFSDNQRNRESAPVLSYEEKIELSYMRLKGFNYIVRNEIGSVEVFVNKPCRNKPTNGKKNSGYDTWVERAYPMTSEEMKRRRDTELGDYNFITWASEPTLISNLIF
ncbi:hypothetical protein [Jeotgalibacillus alimentarius]|uniref:hypothetical protein n=1 Tax=Jeotgalibacillus alimentarius TaxID=135826 RepID=UPI0006972FBE|nr:hypothetical protein [Jeotgalibacillus alimentarius]